MQSTQIEELMARIRQQLQANRKEIMGVPTVTPHGKTGFRGPGYDLSRLGVEVQMCQAWQNAVGTLNPRQGGLLNGGAQLLKKTIQRMLSWYTRPLRQFHGAMVRAMRETLDALEALQQQTAAISEKFAYVASQAEMQQWIQQAVDRAMLQGVDTSRGPKAKAGLYFNDPVMLDYTDDCRAYWSGTHERIVERAWVFRHLAVAAGNRVLDLGCSESLVSFELASNGFQVTAVDSREYPLRHPNLEFLTADICDTKLPANSFDAVIALSAVEHIGIGFYGDPQAGSSDSRAMSEILRVLKPGGRLLLTVPFGQKAMTPLHRIYDSESLRTLIEDFELEVLDFATRLDEKTWICPAEEAKAAQQTYEPTYYLPGAVALAVCKKPLQ